MQIVSTAYHNTGVELEYLVDFTKSVRFYMLAYSLVNRYLGPENSLYKVFQTSFLEAKSKAESRLSKP